MKKFYYILIPIIVIILILGLILILNWVKEIPYESAANAKFSATIIDEGGVSLSSAFQIVFDTEISSASVHKFLNVEPSIDLGFHQGSSKNEVLIAPAEPLDSGTIYKFTLVTDKNDIVWAFQTKTPLEIETIRPADKSVGVTLDQNIEIIFNQMTHINLDEVGNYITIKPYLSGTFIQEGRILRFIPENGLKSNTVYHIEITAGLPTINSDLVTTDKYNYAFETIEESYSLWHINGCNSYLVDERPIFNVEFFEKSKEEENNINEKGIIIANLYQFLTPQDYSNVLFELMESKPSWSQGFKNLSDLNFENAIVRKQYNLVPKIFNEKLEVELPEILNEGYYLLRCKYKNQSRDVMFAISSISTYFLTDADQTLFWVHETENEQSQTVSISDRNGDIIDNIVLGECYLMPRNGDEIYTIKVQDKTLILPCYQSEINVNDNYSNWRYLYIEQNNYDSGDILNFWGLVKPRNGTDLLYERVSVYILSHALNQHVYKGYVALKDNLFNGNIVIPTLQDGVYSLEIWQNNKLLISQDFTLGNYLLSDFTTNIFSANKNFISTNIIIDKMSGYKIEENYYTTSILDSEQYLFIESEGGIKDAIVSDKKDFHGIFAPDTYLNSYVSCVNYKDGKYFTGTPILLELASSMNQLNIEVENNFLNEGSKSSGTIDIYIRDELGNPIKANIVISILKSENIPKIDTKAAIYTDFIPSGLGGEQLNRFESSIEGEGLFFTTLTSDQNGNAVCSYDLPPFIGNCWLIVQAIDTSDEIKAGSVIVNYGNINNELEMEIPVDSTRYNFEYKIGQLQEDTVLSEKTALTIFASSKRLEVITLLLDILLSNNENSDTIVSAEKALAIAHARQLLLDYGGDAFYHIVSDPIDCGQYQKFDGGIGDIDNESSLSTSVKTIAVAPNDIDYYALLSYYLKFLENSSTKLEKIMALSGYAFYKEPVFNDLKILLNSKQLSNEEYLWLLWALYSCGDEQNTSILLDNFLDNKDFLIDKEARIASVLCALCDREDSLFWLNMSQSNENTSISMLERVILARILLPKLSEEESSFIYQISGDEHQISISGINDFLLNGNYPDIQFIDIQGDISFLNIYRVE